MPKLVSVKALIEGNVVAKSIKDNDGNLLLEKGRVLDEALINRLQNWFRDQDLMISIADENEELVEEEENVGPVEIDANLKNNTIDGLKNIYSSTGEELKGAIDETQSCIDKISQKLKHTTDWDYSDEKQIDEDSEQHYFRVAKLAIILANIYNKEVSNNRKISLESIAMAALLHDYGKKFINDEKAIKKLSISNSVLKKCGLPLNILRQPYNNEYHTVYAYASLDKFLPESTRTTILLSEIKDSLYKKFDQMSPNVQAAKIINLCNIYDILLERVIRDNIPLPMENVISYIGQLAQDGTIDLDIYNFFLKHIPVYKKGLKVLLSDGTVAVVMDSTPEFRTKPTVLTLPESGVPQMIDLSETINLVIVSIIPENKTRNQVTEIVQGQLNNTESKLSIGEKEKISTHTQSLYEQKKSFLLNLRKKITQNSAKDSEIGEGKIKK